MSRIPQIATVKSNGEAWLAWTAVACLIVAQQLISVDQNSRLHMTLQNAAHTPWFLLLTILLWVAIGSISNSSLTRRFLICSAISVTLALGLEAAQLPSSRDANLTDVLLNLTGAAAAYALIVAQLAQRNSNIRGFFTGVIVAVILVASSQFQVFQLLWTQHRQTVLMPLLISFDDSRDSAPIKLIGDWEVVPGLAQWQGYEQDNIAVVSLDPSRNWPGVTLVEPARDWSGYETLVITTYLDATKPLPLEIRLQTQTTSGIKSTLSVVLKPGENVINLALSELVAGATTSLEEVRNLYIFRANPQAEESFYLAKVNLEIGIGE